MAKNQAAIPQTLTQEQELEKVFNKYDINGDGKISLAELGSLLNALNSPTSADEVARIMSEIDTDGDGFIDLNEFKAFQCADDDGDMKLLKQAFEIYDKDGNGKICASELHAVLRSLREECTLDECKNMISAFDVDGDGCVNFEEFKKMMARPT